jgi:hypothetical protein
MIGPLPAVLRLRTVPLVLALILLASGTLIVAAMTRTSTTYDEIVMVAGGARGFAGNGWDLVPEHPPLVQYLYGLPVHLARPTLPDEPDVTPAMRQPMAYRYLYAQHFFWRSGNDAQLLTFLGRLPAVACALGLILLAFFYARRSAGDRAGLLAALLTASIPDVIAHGGVAYNDVPLALAFLGAVWAIDEAIRDPRLPRALLAGVLIGLALAIKNSAVALAPVAIVLLAWELVVRRRDTVWLRAVGGASFATLAAAYATLVVVYRGDFLLEEYRYALSWAFGHVTQLPVPSYLLGDISLHGWWYFFPVAFLFKTSAGLHLLVLVAAAWYLRTLRRNPRVLAYSPLRAVAVALLIFGALLLASDLNIGFRYALPALPLLAILTAVGVVRVWQESRRTVRAVLAVAALWPAIHLVSHYPFFLSYLSEYGPGETAGHTVLVDSSLDWGQGLLELRRFMEESGIPAVRFSYFGSALPEGYGISYSPLPGSIVPQQAPAHSPEWVAISATHLTGTYLNGDPFALFREVEPHHVIARSIYLYHLGSDEDGF